MSFGLKSLSVSYYFLAQITSSDTANREFMEKTTIRHVTNGYFRTAVAA